MAPEPAPPLAPAANSVADPAWADALALWIGWANAEVEAYTVRTSRPDDAPISTPSTPSPASDFPPTALNPRAGRAESNRPNTHIVVHTTEGGVAGASGDARKVATWQQAQTGWYRTTPTYQTDPGPARPAGDGWREVYSGYHYLIDEAETVTLADPATHRAFHVAAPGWNRVAIGVAFACQASQWPTMDSTRRNRMIARFNALHDAITAATGLVPTTRTVSLLQPGFAGHGDIQSNRTDPGAGFPWAQVFSSLLPDV